MGISWLASAHLFIAAERPPHLAAVMPLEGLSDVYRESLCRGCVPTKTFWELLGECLLVELSFNMYLLMLTSLWERTAERTHFQ